MKPCFQNSGLELRFEISGNRKKISKLTAGHFNCFQSPIFMNKTVVSKKVGQASPRLLESVMRIQALLCSPRLAYWSEFALPCQSSRGGGVFKKAFNIFSNQTFILLKKVFLVSA